MKNRSNVNPTGYFTSQVIIQETLDNLKKFLSESSLCEEQFICLRTHHEIKCAINYHCLSKGKVLINQ